MSESVLHRPKVLLYADQNTDDRVLVKHALFQIFPEVRFRGVPDGEALLDYLIRTRKPEVETRPLLPDVIILELNMPKKSGIEALAEIKANKNFRHIPVIVFSTSTCERDIRNAYRLGATSFVRKPRSSRQLIKTLRSISQYWTDTQLPAFEELAEAS